MRCPLNRSTDQLVRLFLRKGPSFPQPRPHRYIRLIIYSKDPELNQLLSLTGSVQRPQPILNPQAEAFNPSQPSQSPSTNQTGAPDPEKAVESAEGDTTDSMPSDHGAAHFGALPDSHSDSMRTLTTNEIESGRKILFAYRRYILRTRVKRRSAVATISRCYSRYLRHRNAPRSSVDERYLEFQLEYKTAIQMPEGPRPFSESFYQHKAILLGCMPHVAVYLRSLEHVNRLQKYENRKRLQTAHHKELKAIQARMDACR
ncbi:hypothetical protein FRC11_011693 [Ceratobasidium sp. 423]|nr:hypothetical protein FRC11_011693 [Ceratobasidium sp. 423]